MWGGSLYGRFEASAVFMVLLSLSDRHGEVDMTAEAIAGVTGWPLEFIRKGISELESPDDRSRTPDCEGRRIVLLDDHRDWGWSITNYAKYREEQRSQERREYLREAKRKQRERDREAENRSVNKSTNVNHFQPIAEAEAEAESRSKKNTTAASRPAKKPPPPEFDDFKALYPPRAGSQPWPKALKAINARLADGHVWNEILDGTRRYQAFCRATGKERTEYVMQAATFCGPDKRFLEPWNAPITKADNRTHSNLTAAAAVKQQLIAEGKL
jgi:hypothetical protein